jgi:hypothetical protein
VSRDLPTSTKKLSEDKPQLKKKNACHHEGQGREEPKKIIGYKNFGGLRCAFACVALDGFDCLR